MDTSQAPNVWGRFLDGEPVTAEDTFETLLVLIAENGGDGGPDAELRLAALLEALSFPVAQRIRSLVPGPERESGPVGPLSKLRGK